MQHLYAFAKSSLGLACLVLFFCTGVAVAQTSTFTYQGRLTDNGTPGNAIFDLQFSLYDTATVGTGALQGSPNTVTNPSVQVTDGVFTVQLDFGAVAFSGGDRFLEINVRRPGDPSYTTLAPRQQLTSSPYAVRAAIATANVLKSGDKMNGDLDLGTNNITNAGSISAMSLSGRGAALTSLNPANLSSGSADISITGSAGSFTGNLNGDVIGTQSSTTVVKLLGVKLDPTPPSDGQVLTYSAANGKWIPTTPGIGMNTLFGDGLDGDVTITDATTLTGDMYYQNLTISAGTSLNPGGFRVFVSGTLTLANGASIARNGNNALGSNGGAALEAGTLGGSGAGGNFFNPATSAANSLGGSGGSPQFNGGVASPPAASAGGGGVFRSALQALSGRSLDGAVVYGGGGGGSNIFNGGGGGGGVVVVVARKVVVSGSPTFIGAHGGSGSGSAASGGGGGGGGVVVVITTTPQPAGLTLSADGGGSASGFSGAAGFKAWLN
jgi:hypothetical protein